MSTYLMRDAATMLRRDFRHLRTYPVMTISTVATPTIMLLLFVFAFGGAMSTTVGPTGASYVDYVVPGILLMTIGSGCPATAIGINMDMTEGIIGRFRTMAIARSSVLTGRVIGGMIRTGASLVLVMAISLLIGFRPSAGLGGWLLLVVVLAAITFAMTWLAVAFGLVAKAPENANASTLLLQFGPFVSSAFVRPETMPAGLGWFAAHQPFTPMIETVRGLLFGVPMGATPLVALTWAVLIALGGYLWARRTYDRDPAH